ncbi:MAG: hypothetical protein J6V91_04810, partial [Kiritimatiellae bacterium]|nr:hypothetical protein [Kiritimatiellia bacterium]
MKQLKFMLAAATAIGLATAAQAATSTLDSESFNGYTDGQAVIDSDGVALIDGFSYNGTAGDNESTIIKETEDDMALKVNTGTDPLLRKINYDDGTAVDLSESGFNYLNIDTKVQFTVTPKSDKDNVTAVAGDKLMIYLLETDDGNVLMAKAAAYSEEGAWIDGGKDFRLTLPESIDAVEPNKWYRLVVKAKAFVAGVDEETEAPNAWWPFFQIYIAEENDSDLSDNLCTNDDTDGAGYEAAGIDFGDEIASDYFLSLAVDSSIGDAFGPQSEALKLTHVGFAGEGKVDDLVISTFDPTQTVVDFTLALDDAVGGINGAVNYSCGAQSGELSGSVAVSCYVGDMVTVSYSLKSDDYSASWTGATVANNAFEVTKDTAGDTITLTISKNAPSTVDFTLTLAAGVSSVTWIIGG